MDAWAQVDRAGLRRILSACFDEGELRDLCFDLGIAYAGLAGECAHDKARELIAYCERRGQWAPLVRAVYAARPQAPWPAAAPSADTDFNPERHNSGWTVTSGLPSAISFTCGAYYWAQPTTTFGWG